MGIDTYLTAQNQLEIARADQTKNSAGGFVFALDTWSRLQRFLILGTEGGSYYASERELTSQNGLAVKTALQEDGLRAVAQIVEVSSSGRAPKNTPSIYALAVACCSESSETKSAAFAAIPLVCRTGTHLLQFVKAVKSMRGFGRGLSRAVSRWYASRDADSLAYQLLKYQTRDGWSHGDVLGLTRRHGMGEVGPGHEAAFRWCRCGFDGLGKRTVARKTLGGGLGRARTYGAVGELPKLLDAYRQILALTPGDIAGAVRLIVENKFTHEMVPSHFLGSPEIWTALLEHMPLGAMVRNLGRMGANGLLRPGASAVGRVCSALTPERIAKSLLHPISVLSAFTTYARGHGVRGSLSWDPVSQVVDALDSAFYYSFGVVRSTGKRRLIALDVSGSMSLGEIAGVAGITPRVGSAAMALVTMARDPQTTVVAFSHSLCPVALSARQRLDDVVSVVSSIPMGGTDCALPMLWATSLGIPFDSFEVYTDSETWRGEVHPFEALREYRRKSGISARLVVVGMVSNGFTIADPTDAGMLDVVGFDSAAPELVGSFVAGEI